MRRALTIFIMGVIVGAIVVASLVWYLRKTSAPAQPQIAATVPALIPAPAPPTPALATPPSLPETIIPPVAVPLAVAPSEPAPPPPSSSTSSDVSPPGKLIIPVAGVAASALHDTFNEKRGSDRIHEALDILAPRGTPVVAAGDCTIKKLFTSKPGGLTIYEFDPTQTFTYYYAHLDSYAPNMSEGMAVKQGQTLGYVGTTGNADANTPHLHFAIFKLNANKHWWEGTPINPYPLLTQ